jgi:hypothetical protein
MQDCWHILRLWSGSTKCVEATTDFEEKTRYLIRSSTLYNISENASKSKSTILHVVEKLLAFIDRMAATTVPTDWIELVQDLLLPKRPTAPNKAKIFCGAVFCTARTKPFSWRQQEMP